MPVEVARKPTFLDRFMPSSQTEIEVVYTPSDILSAGNIAKQEHKASETDNNTAEEDQVQQAAEVSVASLQQKDSEKVDEPKEEEEANKAHEEEESVRDVISQLIESCPKNLLTLLFWVFVFYSWRL